MRVLFDIVHPAHVHFFKHMVRDLRARGHETAILAREKDVTSALLDLYGLAHDTVGRPSRRGRLGQLAELARRDLALVRLARRFRADVIVTRNPAGVQAARLTGAVGIFDTDDGTAAGIHFQAARPFAHWLTSPDCLPERWGPRHVPYAGYKQTAYLHPNHFQPDPAVLDEIGVARDQPFFVVRFVAMQASHDSGEAGMTLDAKREVIARLQRHGRVFLSCETRIPDEWAALAYKLPAHRLHDLLAFATLVVGDSQTVAAEAAVLGTPALRASTFAGRIAYLEELEHRYGLTFGYHPIASGAFLAKLDELLARGSGLKASFAAGHQRMLAEKIDVARWFVDFIEQKAIEGQRGGAGRRPR
jgi:hypothetical protein